MIFRSQQRLIIILSVDVDEDRGDAAENGEIDDPSVDPGDALARGLKNLWRESGLLRRGPVRNHSFLR